MLFEAAFTLASVLAGGVAAIVGFGIGSLLTPLLALRTGTKLAVAAVAIPHFFGTALRLWRLRAHIDRSVLLGFGITSILGGLTGALLHTFAASRTLGIVFGLLLILAGIGELSGLWRRVRFGTRTALGAGAVSGLFGGMVGNQGGIRSAALLGFHLDRHAFVATATAIALAVDVARLPVYLVTGAHEILEIWPLVALGTAGVIAGTLGGESILRIIPDRTFRHIVSVLVLLLGIYMLAGGGDPG